MQKAHEHQTGHGHGAGHAHPHAGQRGHAHAAPPATEGRLIRWARLYDILLHFKFLGRLGSLRSMTLDLAALRPGERVLDTGCGTGELTTAAARRVGKKGVVHGVDASPEMIEVARRNALRAAPGVTFHLEPVEAMSFPDDSFDVALSSFVMHHLPGELKQSALLEIRRVLRPGGRIVIIDMQPTSRPPRPWQPGWIVSRLHGQGTSSEAEVKAALEARTALLRDAGYVDVKTGTTRYNWIGYSTARVPD
ncbi:MAG TPA: class I SAM-dependent methyltransferase [Chloroflexia bacterium]|nr:class I SAM-dependent methyltransferase [Chloroflexia bacterium]